MNRNIILIDGYSQKEIEAYLRKWVREYKDDLNPDMEIYIYKDLENKHYLTIENMISNSYFYYLVNFLSNPSANRSNFNIKGYCIGIENNLLFNIHHLVYVSPNDKEGDNVYCVTEKNENYKIQFDNNILPLNENVSYVEVYDYNFNKPYKIIKAESITSKNRKEIIVLESKVFFRANVIFTIFSILVFGSLLFTLLRFELKFSNHIITFASVLLAFWLCFDEGILQKNKLIIISVLLGCLGFSINSIILLKTNNYNLEYPIFLGHITLTFVLIQFLIRRLYIRFFNKEPRVVGMAGSLSEAAYSFILVITLLVVAPVTSEYIIKFILS